MKLHLSAEQVLEAVAGWLNDCSLIDHGEARIKPEHIVVKMGSDLCQSTQFDGVTVDLDQAMKDTIAARARRQS